MLDLLIVILNYNTRDLLRNCLHSLRGQRGLRVAVCVVDNASPDGSADMVATEFLEVTLVRNPLNNGFSAGNNLGLRTFGFPSKAQSRYVMLLNPDTIVPPNALAQLIAFAEQHPDVGIVGPKLLLEDGTLDKACRRSFPTPEVALYRLLGLSKLFPKSKRFGRYNMTYLDIDQSAEVDAVVGACMLVRADAVAKVGLLDEQFFMYGEDLDWCLRIKQVGYRVMYYPIVTVHHIKRAASRASQKAQFEFQRAMWLFYKKHYQPHTALPVDLLVKLGLVLRGRGALLREMLPRRNEHVKPL